MGCFQNEGFLYKLDQFWKKKRYEKLLLGSGRKILLFLHETIEVGLNPSNHLKKAGKIQCFYCLRNCVARWQPVVGTWDFKTRVSERDWCGWEEWGRYKLQEALTRGLTSCYLSSLKTCFRWTWSIKCSSTFSRDNTILSRMITKSGIWRLRLMDNQLITSDNHLSIRMVWP